jgi:hypothetical protein
VYEQQIFLKKINLIKILNLVLKRSILDGCICTNTEGKVDSIISIKNYLPRLASPISVRNYCYFLKTNVLKYKVGILIFYVSLYLCVHFSLFVCIKYSQNMNLHKVLRSRPGSIWSLQDEKGRLRMSNFISACNNGSNADTFTAKETRNLLTERESMLGAKFKSPMCLLIHWTA